MWCMAGGGAHGPRPTGAMQDWERADRVVRPYEATQVMPALIAAGHMGPALRGHARPGSVMKRDDMGIVPYETKRRCGAGPCGIAFWRFGEDYNL